MSEPRTQSGRDLLVAMAGSGGLSPWTLETVRAIVVTIEVEAVRLATDDLWRILLDGNPGLSEHLLQVEARLEAGGGSLYEVRDGTLRKTKS